jgi:hypothetical protein
VKSIVTAEAATQFAKRVRYIRYLLTVPQEECERHNNIKRARGRLQIAKLCTRCQYDLHLT